MRLSGIGLISLGLGRLAAEIGKASVTHALSWNLAAIVAAVLGVALAGVGITLISLEFAKMVKRPFDDHLRRIEASLPAEELLLNELLALDLVLLETARSRLMIESKRVARTIGWIGGRNIQASLVGAGALGYAVISGYLSLNFPDLAIRDVTYFGVVFLLGISIAAVVSSRGAGIGEFYIEMIELAVEVKRRGGNTGVVRQFPWRKIRNRR
jgi:hypothetical protein